MERREEREAVWQMLAAAKEAVNLYRAACDPCTKGKSILTFRHQGTKEKTAPITPASTLPSLGAA